MKRLITTTAAFVLTLALGTTAFAAHPRHNPHYSTGSANNIGYCNFVDVDNDGICDNGDMHCIFTDTNGDGICDNGDMHCIFTDTNGDGICDHGDTHCFYYLDADNDGICDNCQNKNVHNGAVCANGYACTASGGHRTGHHGGRHH